MVSVQTFIHISGKHMYGTTFSSFLILKLDKIRLACVWAIAPTLWLTLVSGLACPEGQLP